MARENDIGHQIAVGFHHWMIDNGREVDLARIRVEQARAAREYKKAWREDALTPEIVEGFYQSFWDVKVEEAGLGIRLEIPECDRSAKELSELRAEHRGVVLIPDTIMSTEGLFLLPQLFPNTIAGKVPINLFSPALENDDDSGGCLDVEMLNYAPHPDTDEMAVRDLFASQGRRSQRLQTYIVASHVNKILNAHYFDETNYDDYNKYMAKAWSRLPGSRLNGWTVAGGFEPDGVLNMNLEFREKEHHYYLGARSEGRKKYLPL